MFPLVQQNLFIKFKKKIKKEHNLFQLYNVQPKQREFLRNGVNLRCDINSCYRLKTAGPVQPPIESDTGP